MKHLYFDESGFTGNNLLDMNQPFFCYLGLDSNSEIENSFLHSKAVYGYTESEVKGFRLCKSVNGQKLIKELWNLCSDKIKFVLHDKKYALAAKIFEYVYEPVFADYNIILYNSGLHIFFANFLYYDFLFLIDEKAEAVFSSFQEFIRSEKSIIFSDNLSLNSDESSFLKYFISFCKKFSKKIASDVSFNDEADSWLLDLSATSLFNLLGAFEGEGVEPLVVVCDNSKPLLSFASFLDAEINNEKIAYAGLRDGEKSRITFNLAKKIEFGDSKTNVSLQIADILASSIIYAANHKTESFSEEIRALSENSFARNVSVMPLNILEDYTELELSAYLEMLRILSLSYSKKEKLFRVSCLTNFIEKRHRFDLLRYLK